jgi:hypothetical protein
MTLAKWRRGAANHWISVPRFLDTTTAHDIGDLPGGMVRPGYAASPNVDAILLR